jgi:multiple sugar transport system permease protein
MGLFPLAGADDLQPRRAPIAAGDECLPGPAAPGWGQILAFGVLPVLVVFAFFQFFQRWFVQGVAGSAVKG